MADAKLTALTAAVPTADDLVYFVDRSDTTDDPTGSSRSATVAELAGGGLPAFNLNDAGKVLGLQDDGTGAAELAWVWPDLDLYTGLQFEVSAGVDLYQNDAMTTPCTAGGQTLRGWKDQSPFARHLKSPDRPPTVASEGGLLVYQGANDKAMWTDPLSNAGSWPKFTIHVLCKLGNGTFTSSPLVSFKRIAPDGMVAANWSNQDLQYFLSSQNTSPVSATGTPSGLAAAYVLLSFVRDGSSVFMYKDGFLCNVFSVADAAQLVNAVVVGGWSENPGAAGFFTGFPSRIAKVAVYNVAHSQNHVAAYAERTRAEFPTLFALHDPFVVHWGNSITQAYLVYGTGGYVWKAGNGLGLGYYYNQAGMTGSGNGVTTARMIASYRRALDMLRFAPVGAKKVISVVEGTNAIRVDGVSGAVAASQLLTLYGLLRDGGYDEVIAHTILPASDSGFNTQRNISNPLLRSGYAGAGATRMADWAARPSVGDDGDELGANYVDGLHPAAAGHTELAIDEQAALAAALA